MLFTRRQDRLFAQPTRVRRRRSNRVVDRGIRDMIRGVFFTSFRTLEGGEGVRDDENRRDFSRRR